MSFMLCGFVRRLQVLIIVGYNLSDLKVSELNNEFFTPRLECYIYDDYSIQNISTMLLQPILLRLLL